LFCQYGSLANQNLSTSQLLLAIQIYQLSPVLQKLDDLEWIREAALLHDTIQSIKSTTAASASDLMLSWPGTALQADTVASSLQSTNLLQTVNAPYPDASLTLHHCSITSYQDDIIKGAPKPLFASLYSLLTIFKQAGLFPNRAHSSLS
jgi:hypothetical protein